MPIIIAITIAGTENDHSTGPGHSCHFLIFLLRVVAKNVAAHGYIHKLVWKWDVGDKAIHWINVNQPPSPGFCFEIVAQIGNGLNGKNRISLFSGNQCQSSRSCPNVYDCFASEINQRC